MCVVRVDHVESHRREMGGENKLANSQDLSFAPRRGLMSLSGIIGLDFSVVEMPCRMAWEGRRRGAAK